MLWLGAFLSLDLTTSTPDALCPPLEEARAAVKARVGEVRGNYRAEFALVRADDGRQTLALTLREEDKEVLRRELPLDSAGCQDAAQTIALVLERYFDAIERPTAPPPPAPAAAEEPPRTTPSPSPPPSPGPAPRQAPRDREFRIKAGLLYDRELGTAVALGASYLPQALRLSSRWRVGFGVDVAPFLAGQTDAVRGERVEAFLLQGALSVPLAWSSSKWRFAFGPWAQLRLQGAQAASFTGGDRKYRLVPGAGGFIQAGLELTPTWAIVAGVAAGPQLKDAASQYVLEGTAGKKAVLVPGSWFGHVQLCLELKL
jgi:hypothetical protein